MDPLERPVWYALNERQNALAVATGVAVRIDPRYGPFAAAADRSEEALLALAATLADADDTIALVEAEPWPVPPGTQVVRTGELLQMVCEEPEVGEPDSRIHRLDQADAPEMAELALATEPGPWGSLTHRYGTFYGIRVNGRLAAMAGQRMLLPGLAEVSAVCTWPEFRGQGMAAALIREVVRGFVARGDTPFLHSYAHNTGAIRLYEKLGFRPTRTMHLTVLARA
ncbi:MAG: GNAT family N-acetyltransferase [Novosphingobium sp.]|nr:GNAT family N-acetyltransferase [Novosphingobium sp.]